MITLAERYRLPISRRTRILLVAIIVLLLAGIAIAATEPGDLGDDHIAADLPTTTEADDSSQSAAGQATTSTTEAEAPASTTTTTAAGSGGSTAAPGSGLGAEGAGSAGEDDLADTGGLPLAVPGALALVAVALSRRIARR